MKILFLDLSALLALTGIIYFSGDLSHAFADGSKAEPAHTYKFTKKKITIGKVTVTVEIADTDELRERGLMERTELSDDEGMVFVFPRSQFLSFWMKNTLIPLSIGYFDDQGKLLQILEMEPASPMEVQPKVYPSKKLAKYALEEPKGWFTRKKIQLGAKLKL